LFLEAQELLATRVPRKAGLMKSEIYLVKELIQAELGEDAEWELESATEDDWLAVGQTLTGALSQLVLVMGFKQGQKNC
jgi:hypothetical protein